MKRNLSLALMAMLFACSCSKKSNPSPTPSNVIEYSFTANTTGKYVVNYYDGVSLGTAQNVTSSSWSTKVTIPQGTKTASIFFTAGQNPPYTADNSGTVTIKLNGNTVATGSAQFTGTNTLAEATYTYTSN